MQYSVEAIESGAVDLAYVLEQIELQISEAKEEAFSWKDIQENIEKWLAACEEERWLEEYSWEERKLQGQLLAEQEAFFGSKPSPTETGRKAPRHSIGGKRSTTTSGNPHKRHPKSVNSTEFKPPSIRKPYSPASATGSSKINPKNSQEHENGARKVTPKEAQATKTLLASTPSKSRSTGNDEIVTPMTVPTLVPTTPTISVPMQTAATPDIPYAPSALAAAAVPVLTTNGLIVETTTLDGIEVLF
ncbi:hypothetical protein Nepgr_019077 [Nepenthes gracilis]|uniref:Uncharacterized protein n=1 Tax=Nepenthes gracilis TaxID=150966 RepID=A0AAD3XUY6_NEPGR|nr:hypothetical protein Nepgr_019077 [Nepenthes gracilis]